MTDLLRDDKESQIFEIIGFIYQSGFIYGKPCRQVSIVSGWGGWDDERS